MLGIEEYNIVNDPNTLRLVWTVSWALCAFSMLMIMALSIALIRRNQREDAFQSRYQELRKLLIIYLEASLSELRQTFIRSDIDLEVLAKLAEDILRSAGGDSRVNIGVFIKKLGLEEWIMKRAEKGRVKDRISALQLLGFLPPYPEHTILLAQTLSSEKDIRVRYIASESMSRLAEPASFKFVLRALGDIEELSPLLIYDLFSRFGPSICLELVHALDDPDTAENIKAGIIHTLGDIPNVESYKALSKMTHSENDDLCSAAFQSLAKTGQPINAELIKSGANHPNWRVRMYAAKCASRADHFPVAELQKLFTDRVWLVSIEAAEALYSFGAAGRRILEMLANTTSDISARAQNFLEEKKSDAV